MCLIKEVMTEYIYSYKMWLVSCILIQQSGGCNQDCIYYVVYSTMMCTFARHYFAIVWRMRLEGHYGARLSVK